jgi:vancomycin resistance protein VanJ
MMRKRLSQLVRFLLSVGSISYTILLIVYLLFRLGFGDRFWWLAFLNNFAPWTFLPLFVALPLVLLFRLQFLVVLILP